MRSFLDKCRRLLAADEAANVIAHGELRLFVLHTVLSDGPMTRSEIERRVAEWIARLGADSAPIESVVDMLDRLDYLRPFTHGQVFGITEDGIALLDANRTMLATLLGQHGPAPGASAETEAALLRSLNGLGVALRLSLVAGRLSRRQARKLARTLDALTVQIDLA